MAELRRIPARLFVCTNKAVHFARPVLEHFGLATLFDGIHGADLDGRFDDKGDLIAHMIAVEKIVCAAAIMVGDRSNDVAAAARHGIPTVGALWGYGGSKELTEAGAAALCRSPAELPDAIRALALPLKLDRRA